uniref:Chromatin-modifying protein 1a n=1 Tax=Romanomermis culicivorax TaxID=13658 RepID=A0A915I3I8_ROMCU
MFSSGADRMENCLFELKFTTKQLERLAKKSEKDMNGQKAKVKKALTQGNVEGARIYAENTIRKKNEALNYLRFASKVDAVAARIQTASTMKQITRNMKSVVGSLDKALASMDLETVSKVMEKFEKEFEDLDVRTSVMQDSMNTATALSAPQEQVDMLVKQVAEENGLDIAAQLPSVDRSLAEKTKVEEQSLNARLAALREDI